MEPCAASARSISALTPTSPPWIGPVVRPAPAAEDIAERASAPAEECLEDVGNRTEALEVRGVAAAAQALVAVAIVGRAALGVREHLICLRRLLELLLGVGVLLVDVGMKLARQTPESGFDLGLGRGSRDAQHLVVVAARLTGAHRRPPLIARS